MPARNAMKDRSTVICTRDERILLVARAHPPWPVRWALPGGKIRSTETPPDACRRELWEETSIEPLRLYYLFQFGGLIKRHHVFLADMAFNAHPHPRNEIAQCQWFTPQEIAHLPASIPTRAIVALFMTWHAGELLQRE
jgi:8-oxo-dGTP diphosphatase